MKAEIQLAISTLHVHTCVADGFTPAMLAGATMTKVFKSTEGSVVALAKTKAERPLELVVKIRPLSIGGRLKLLAGRSRLLRQWSGAKDLLRLGQPTSRPLLHGATTLRGQRAEVLVSEFVTGTTLLHHLRDESLTQSDARRLSRVLAQTIVRMVRSGRMNRDFKPSNLIVGERDASGGRSISQIDTVAIRRCHPARLDQAPAHMLMCLMLEPMGCDCEPSTRQQIRLLRDVVTAWNDENDAVALDPEVCRSGILMLGRLVAERIRAHGDPTPQDNPLA